MEDHAHRGVAREPERKQVVPPARPHGARDLAAAMGNQAFGRMITDGAGGPSASSALHPAVGASMGRAQAPLSRSTPAADVLQRQPTQTVELPPVAIERSVGTRDPEGLGDARCETGPQVAVSLIQRQELDVDPMPAVNAVDAWRRKASVLIDGVRAWKAGNWIDFLKRTSKNPRLGFSDSQLASVASNALGNLLTELGSKTIRAVAKRSAAALGAAIGTAIEPGAGTVIGFLIGVLVESAASWIWENITGKSESDTAAADASQRTGDLIASQHSFLTTEAGKAKSEMEELVTATKGKAEAATSQDAVTAIKDWAEHEEEKTEAPPPASDTSMSLDLLKTWVLEHAGDEEDAASDTSEEQWERAVEHAYGEGRELENHPEVFAFQTRGEWAKAGLAHAAQSDAMIAKARELVVGAEDPAGVVEAYFHDKKYTFTSAADPEALARYVTEHNFGAGVADWGKQAIRDGQFRFECTLDVTTGDGTCYVDEWNFEIVFLSEEAKGLWVRANGADRAAFDVEPD